ncbi:MAG: DUF4389 domain-containing protein [Acidimicrobiales bacterium]|nr:DUF4389 domain-containing protein [Acidimicrobiales bacterium]
MRFGRIVALIAGCLLILPAVAILVGGALLGLGYIAERDDDGFFDVSLNRMETLTPAITAEDADFRADPGSPDWVLDALDADIRLRATGANTSDELFIGIAREVDLDRYLAGVAHDELIDVNNDLEGQFTRRVGNMTVAAPTAQDFWVASSSGVGMQELTWEATSGRWAAALMNADGAPGLAADVNVGAKAGFVLPLSLLMIGVGALFTGIAGVLIAAGVRSPHGTTDGEVVGHTHPAFSEWTHPEPVALTARLDPALSRWLWLVKWFLAIPHFIALVFLWAIFVVLTIVAAVSILFTGRYPRGIFEFNVGVMRWTWRVSYYATTGGIGSDRYPPFSLSPEPGDHAELEIVYPERMSRALVLVKWILAIPQLLVVGVLAGSASWSTTEGNVNNGGSLLGLLVLVAGVVLLFTGRYPRSLFSLIIGLNRWIYRVIAYVAFMTDEYPPFRLDQGGSEPDQPRTPPEPSVGSAGASPESVDLRSADAPELVDSDARAPSQP